MIRVTAPSRLHFGLFALPAPGVTHWPNLEGQPTLPARYFGGVGLMIDRPGVQLRVQPADVWSGEGRGAERAVEFGQRFVSTLPKDQRGRAFTLVVERCAPEHAGLGTGTQLALAVAGALALALDHRDWGAEELATRVGRGLRSSLGIHGFEHGGLLVEGGKRHDTAISPLLVHRTFPDALRVLLVVPRGEKGIHGEPERDIFAHLPSDEQHLRRTETLCRLVLLGMLPALAELDLPAFGETLYEFNRCVGEMFAPWQSGLYATPRTAELIAWLRERGIRGVGQSSWGPAVFAIDTEETLEQVHRQLLQQGPWHEDEVLLCRAATQGSTVG